MPNHDHECQKCGKRQELFILIKDLENKVFCTCGGLMKRLITQGHGGTHGDEAAWIESTNVGLTGRFDPPVTNRTEWKQRMKEKGVSLLED